MSFEKSQAEYFPPPRADEEAITLKRTWSDEEERAAKRKLDLIIMPILTLGFFCLQLDRGNISNALTDRFLQDVGITQNQFNVGQQMLSLGIVLFEVPSNMILYRVGPGRWLTLQLFLFGLVSTFQSFQRRYGPFIATRFILGLTESGFIPGGLWTLSTWYTRAETAKRVMFFYFGNQIGQASSKLLAYGILHMRGVGGQPGWFWLFTLMGLFTILGGFVFGFFLPNSYDDPRTAFLPWYKGWFTPRELEILRGRVLMDDPLKGKKKSHIDVGAFARTFKNWRIWLHVLITLCNNGPQRGFDTYSPSLVASMGYPALKSNALASVGFWLQVPVSFVFSYVSDRYNCRGETVIAGLSCHLLGYVFNRIFTEQGSQGLRYFGVIWTQTFGTFSHPLNLAWLSLTANDSEERALAMALGIMGANTAGIYGAQIFRSDDKPRYRRAFAIGIAVLAVGVALAVARFVDFKINGRRREEEKETPGSDSEASSELGHEKAHQHSEDIVSAPKDIYPVPSQVAKLESGHESYIK